MRVGTWPLSYFAHEMNNYKILCIGQIFVWESISEEEEEEEV
jgi:hypothetical protein